MRRIVQLAYFGELALFALTAGAAAYCSEKQEWILFTVFLVISLLLFGLLKYLESEPMLTRLKKLEEREFNLARRFDAWGIRDIFNMKDVHDLHARNLANIDMIKQGSQLALLGESGTSYFDPAVRRHWDEVKKKLGQGCPMRLLLINPFCTAKAIRNERNGIRSLLDPKLNMHAIASAVANYTNLELRFTDAPYCSIFFTEHEMMYDPYHLGKIGDRIENYFLAFSVTRKDGVPETIYDVLRDHFEYLWDNGLRLSAFLDAFGEKLDDDSRRLLMQKVTPRP